MKVWECQAKEENMSDFKLFQNPQFGSIRTITEGNKVLFCGSDVAKALGYVNTKDALIRHCREDGVAFHDLTDNLGRKQQAKFISEGNLYRLIANSKLPTAEKFEKWVFDEVLPTIHKTGGYVANDDLFVDTYLPFADEHTKSLFKTTLSTIRQLNGKIEQDKPKVLFADSVSASHTSILVGDLAKLIRQNGVDIGQKRLFAWLRDNNFLVKRGESYNMPTQYSMDLKIMEVKETTINNPDGSVRITKTPKITGKGQLYFVNKFLGKEGK